MAKKVIDDRGVSDTVVVEEPVEEEFASAFENAETGIEADQETAAIEPDETVVESDQAADAAPDTLAGDEDAEDEKYEQKYKTLQGIHKHDKGLWDTEKTTLLQQIEDAKKVDLEVEPVKLVEKTSDAKTFIEALTEEQKDQLTEYDREFDVVSKMEGLKRKAEFDKLRNEMREWKEGVLATLDEQGARLDPVLQRTEMVEEDIHFSRIKDIHADLEEHRDSGALLAWIESKPNYMKTALMEVYNSGAAEDVIELITDFKDENNLQNSEDEDDPSKLAATELEEKRRKKRETLRAVNTRPNAVNVAKAAVDDYEGAFEEASDKV